MGRYLLIISAALLILGACGNSESATEEEATNAIEEGSTTIQEGIEDGAEAVEQGVEEGADAVEEGIEEGSAAIEEGMTEAEEFVEEDLEAIVTNVQNKLNEYETKVDEQLLGEGETAELNEEAFIAKNEEAYEELYDLYNIDTYDGADFQTLISEDKIDLLEKGAKLEVVEIDLTEVKVINPQTNETGYIHLSLLTPSS